jgi:predicted ribonuclease YlaK
MELVKQLTDADEGFRNWLELSRNWNVTLDRAENAKQVRLSAERLEKILSVLDAASTNEVILVPDTNSLIAESDPTKYRALIGQESFVFMLLPTVLSQLDRLKIEHRNPEVREKARNVVVRTKGWRNQGSLASGVTVDKSILVKSSHQEPDMERTLSWLDANNEDDRIIASVLALQAGYPAAHVTLVSGDINILNKADAALIDTNEGP